MPQLPVQQKIGIEDIQDGVIILKDGNLRAVLMASAVNFALKSTDEQDGLIFKYQSFLNSLDFPVQIEVISRQLDISPYLATLEQKRKEQPSELLKIQIAEYVDFIKKLVQIRNIMQQTFLVTVPLARIEKKETGGIMETLNLLNPAANKQEDTKSLEELKSQLWQRVEYVVSGLSGCGVKAVPLNTQEIIELFFHLYNMGQKEKPILNLGKEQNAV